MHVYLGRVHSEFLRLFYFIRSSIRLTGSLENAHRRATHALDDAHELDTTDDVVVKKKAICLVTNC